MVTNSSFPNCFLFFALSRVKEVGELFFITAAMVEKSQIQCPSDNRNYNRQREGHAFLRVREDSVGNADTWHTSNQDAFCKPEVGETMTIGRRKHWVRNVLNERATRTIADQMNPKEVTDDGVKPSEYFDKFCDPQFTPLMDRPDTLVNNLVKYPLYACNNRTLYKEQIERGALKSRSEISNLNDPFRRNCAFTTSPDQALREPTGGY